MAIVLKTDGTFDVVFPPDFRLGFTCGELYRLIGNGCSRIKTHLIDYGSMEYVMVRDWEAHLRSPIPLRNHEATRMLFDADYGPNGSEVLGTVILCEVNEYR